MRKQINTFYPTKPHEGFNKEYPNVYDRTDFKELGENLVKDVTSERDAIRAWENSKEHKEMLDKDYKYGCVRCEGTACVLLVAN